MGNCSYSRRSRPNHDRVDPEAGRYTLTTYQPSKPGSAISPNNNIEERLKNFEETYKAVLFGKFQKGKDDWERKLKEVCGCIYRKQNIVQQITGVRA